jgi:hypothetical protein
MLRRTLSPTPAQKPGGVETHKAVFAPLLSAIFKIVCFWITVF